MKAIIIKLLAILYLALPLIDNNAQETFEKKVDLKNNQAINLDLKFAENIIVKTWEKKQLFIKAIVEHNFKEPLEYNLLEFNTTSELKIEEKIINLEKTKTFSNGSSHNRNCVNLDILYEVYIPANYELSINSISGNIEVKQMENKLKLETISGFVDVSINPSNKYDLKCSTISGSIYSDLSFDDDEMNREIVGSKINTRINGGGKKLYLKSISGDIFIRKRN